MDTIEREFLKEKMKQAIVYQSYFGKDGDDKFDRIAENCVKLAIQFYELKENNEQGIKS
jgi:hypothetical protein